MSIENLKAECYWDSHSEEIKSIVEKAYIEGYKEGFRRSAEINIDGVTFYDLGLPNGTLWSEPICVKHGYTYVTYDLKSYSEVNDLCLPTLNDFEELLNNCAISSDTLDVAKAVRIVGPSGNRISIGTKDYKNNPGNPNSVICRREGEQVEEGKNMFWLKSDIKDNKAMAVVVDYKTGTISLSSHFIGFKLPYILVKK